MEAASTLKALQMAINNREYKTSPLMHHSDRGLQYCSKLYTSCLINNGIAISMTESGDPYENAVAERVNGILKDEFGLADQMVDLKDALMQTHQSISAYNNQRPHLSCSMFTPKQMHSQQTIKVKTYNKKAQTSLVDI
jgi:transposase InsO family protein